ncbi:MAG: hypothetical protein L0212_05835 [Acidobacteria bacterium]|nr:hypothetical protein [Acidobacteriota bacterium]
MTIAARPVPDTPEAEEIFGVNAAAPRAGFLPVELLIVNQRAEPIRVDLGRIRVVQPGEEFDQLAIEEIALALHPLPKSKEPVGSTRIPKKIPKDKNRTKREEGEAGLRSRQLRLERIPAGGQARGYLYFDLRGSSIRLSEAFVYVPDVEVEPSGEKLFFFEVSLKEYAKP